MIHKNNILFCFILLATGYAYAAENNNLLKIERDALHEERLRLNQLIHDTYPLLKQRYKTLSVPEKKVYMAQLNAFHKSPLFTQCHNLNENFIFRRGFQKSEDEKR